MEKTYQDEAVQNQLNQNESNSSIAPSSKPLDYSEPSASGSQKSEVTKKKRKNKEPLVTVIENVDDETIGGDPELTLANLGPRKKKHKSKIGNQYAPSQKDADIIIGGNLILEAFSQQNVSIKNSIFPNAPYTESVPLQGHSIEGERSQVMSHTVSGEHISIETPISTQGELPNISSIHTILSESTTT